MIRIGGLEWALAVGVALGLAVRAAFNESDDFETLLCAVLDAVTSGERPRF